HSPSPFESKTEIRITALHYRGPTEGVTIFVRFATLYSRRRSQSAQKPRRPAKFTWHNLFWHDDGHLLLCGSTTAVLPDDHDRVIAGIERLREVPETAVGADAW